MRKLCKCGKTKKNERWYPNSIQSLDDFLLQTLQPIDSNNAIHAVRRNIAYNLQYLEYLIKTVKELDLSEILFAQTYKTIIITGISIVESLFFYILEKDGDYKKIEWKTDKKNNIMVANDQKIEIVVQSKLQKAEKIPYKFDTMCNKIIGRKLLGPFDEIYLKLSTLKQLRNKIHIYDVDGLHETDYNSFNYKEYVLIKDFLYQILNGVLFPVKSPIFDFLK